jgi:hypothetical protein
VRENLLAVCECFCWIAFRLTVLVLLAAGVVALRVVLAVVCERLGYW